MGAGCRAEAKAFDACFTFDDCPSGVGWMELEQQWLECAGPAYDLLEPCPEAEVTVVTAASSSPPAGNYGACVNALDACGF